MEVDGSDLKRSQVSRITVASLPPSWVQFKAWVRQGFAACEVLDLSRVFSYSFALCQDRENFEGHAKAQKLGCVVKYMAID